MPAKSYVENPNFWEYEASNVREYPRFVSHDKPSRAETQKAEIPKMQETATTLGRWERAKTGMTRLLEGEIKTEGLVGKRHHVRFWKNSKLRSARLQTQLPTPSNNSSPATRTSSIETLQDSKIWVEESVIYSPLGPPLITNEGTTPVEVFYSSDKITQIPLFEANPNAFDISKCSAASAKFACLSSGSSVPASQIGSEAFSPTDGFGVELTPITPIVVDESKSTASKLVDRTREPVPKSNISLVDNRGPGKVPAVRPSTTPLESVKFEEESTHADLKRDRSLPSNFIFRDRGLSEAQVEVRSPRESVEVTTNQNQQVRFNERNNTAERPEWNQRTDGQYRKFQRKPQTNKTKVNVFSKTWENFNEERWYVRVLHDYCPVRFRKNKRPNFDSHQFRAMQSKLTFEALAEQEVRRQDRKLIFRPNNCNNKSFIRRWLNFEEDKDILDSMDHFIICNEGLTPIFRGSRPAVREHLFRRWLNFDRNRAIICEQLMEGWLEDKQYLVKLKKSREEREQMRAEMETRQKNYDKIPPPSFFIKKFMSNLAGNRSRIGKPPKRGSQIVVLKNEPLFGSQYFENKKIKAKRWIKDLLLGIN